MVSPQVTNLVIILGMMQVSKRIPFENPEVLLGVRTMYLASNIIILALYIYVGSQITKKKDLKTLKYVEPPATGMQEEPRPVVTTVQEYDRRQLRALFKSQLMGVAMMAFMHFYMKYTNPLLVQSVLPLKGALESNLVKIHVYQQPAKGDLERPWKAPSAFGMSQGEVKKDKASIENAEKNWRGGAKDE